MVVVAEGGELGDGRVAMVVEGASCEGELVEGAGACDDSGGGAVLVTGSSPEPSADPSAPASLSSLVTTNSLFSRGISLVATARERETEVWHHLSFSVNHYQH